MVTPPTTLGPVVSCPLISTEKCYYSRLSGDGG